jgi:expansin (peptidoglycan-binding protein)
MGPCKEGRITYYKGWEKGGACSFGAPHSKTGAGYVFGAAPNEAFYAGGARCGECYELVGPRGAIRVMITDLCPVKGNVPCIGDMDHFDLTQPTFPYLADPTLGVANVTYRLVACDVSGPVRVYVREGSSVWWCSLTVINHRVGIAELDVSQDAGATWLSVKRESYNAWNFKPTSGSLQFPVVVRITGTTGDQVFADLPAPTPDTVFDARSQFPVPQTSSAVASSLGSDGQDVCCSPPDHITVVYDDVLGGNWHDWSYSVTTDLASTVDPHSGTHCIQAAMQGWGGVQIGSGLAAQRDQYTDIEFWVKS